MIKVVDAKHVQDFQIWLLFSDGRSGIADLSDLLWGEVFEPLKDVCIFKKFKISSISHTIEWEQLSADIAPEYLYEKIKATTSVQICGDPKLRREAV